MKSVIIDKLVYFKDRINDVFSSNIVSIVDMFILKIYTFPKPSKI